ncbi:TlpA disulfide reductase family protein [Ascidiimonas aurantiaca]|uniref:TlpA family protein disulfide reductase n=1 Tax=Ascidiimonas aurantiaca TaxID=1685432 RepID=UPI0030ED8054
MKISKKTIRSLLLMLLVGIFFIPPVAHESKVFLNRILAFSPNTVPSDDREPVTDFDWKLKDENWEIFNFKRSEGNVVFVHFWASWKIPSVAEVKSIQKLYNEFNGKVDFYIITNEMREPVVEFMEENEYSFPVTYLIIGEKMPFDANKVPSSYIIDKDGLIVVQKEGIANWYSKDIRDLLESLIND